MSDPKCARALLEAAERDILTLISMSDAAPEESYGFHVQQAAEKAFKAPPGVEHVAHFRITIPPPAPDRTRARPS